MNAIVVFDPKSAYNTAKIKGTIIFEQGCPSDLTFVNIHLSNFPPNKEFACHIHNFGDLSEGCTSLCSHFNPYNRMHGNKNLHGPDRHVGDLAIPNGNLKSDSKGEVKIQFYDDLISLFYNERCIIGRSVVIHEKADDGGKLRNLYTKEGIESSKTGNSGKRIVCALIGIARPLD